MLCYQPNRQLSFCIKGCLTQRARGRRDSHRQNQLILALSTSVSEMNPDPPAAGNASRWAGDYQAELRK